MNGIACRAELTVCIRKLNLVGLFECLQFVVYVIYENLCSVFWDRKTSQCNARERENQSMALFMKTEGIIVL